MKHARLLTKCIFVALLLPLVSCEREDGDNVPPTIDTLPNSEWWECDSIDHIAMGGRTLTLNISWEDEVFRSYTNILQNSFSLEDGQPVRFHVDHDTMYYLDLGVYYPDNPNSPIWHIVHDSDTTMTFNRCGEMVMHDNMSFTAYHFIRSR
jgi:hypothetical protein